MNPDLYYSSTYLQNVSALEAESSRDQSPRSSCMVKSLLMAWDLGTGSIFLTAAAAQYPPPQQGLHYACALRPPSNG